MSNFAAIALEWWPVLLAYVIGATPFGFLAGKMKGIDIRNHGSGNIGATNVLRTLGKPIGITVFALDVLKGLVPVLIAKLVTDDSLVHILSAVATIMGHNYTFWLNFKGGKGIATTAGAAISILFWPIILAALMWVILLKSTRYVSVASLGAAITIPTVKIVQSLIAGNWDIPALVFAFAICILAFWRHRTNIRRLLKGEENRFQSKKEKQKAREEAQSQSAAIDSEKTDD